MDFEVLPQAPRLGNCQLIINKNSLLDIYPISIVKNI